ncbi:hypothetical protein [Leptospira neocaledonica]|uniref:DUF2946 domain-containing protein n=1 Tax=Leptospira neocaledonica TaxID=2023192 RepID=A0A2M9ZZK7_9LEPT|nr:hypothetical protein [Leptospira neocaledonica]PJZ77421.1 hypothetical protein CH365_07480 [Leptospira neocaledonica]
MNLRLIQTGILRFFIILFVCNFVIQKVIDNEAVCGAVGESEDHCPYAIHTPDHDDDMDNHICINCPCNLTLFVSWDLYMTRIYGILSVSFYQIQEPVILTYEDPIRLFRPPKISSIA